MSSAWPRVLDERALEAPILGISRCHDRSRGINGLLAMPTRYFNYSGAVAKAGKKPICMSSNYACRNLDSLMRP